MSDCERTTLVALYKIAILSELLSISLKKSNISDSLVIWANLSKKNKRFAWSFFFFICFWQFPFNANSKSHPRFWSQKTSESLEKPMSEFPTLQHNLCITVCFSLSRHLSVPRQSHTMLSNLGFTPSSPPPCAPDCINCIHKFRHPCTVLERSNSLSWFTLR